MGTNKIGKHMQWQFCKDNWTKIYSRFKNVSGLVKNIATWPLNSFCTYEAAKDVEEFFAANSTPEATMQLARTLENIRSRAAWCDRDKEDIATWLDKVFESNNA
eukprot:TRINITY_DN3929_c0_g1_i2.p3 TRINITY_DN3929_c0_g1~~TRINITY_DN3929_c0_g1_i2.p3  ORF type:complete len:104 (-),score=25.27 TRINITY_DN3929_c0_g1_i2:677-988(-)